MYVWEKKKNPTSNEQKVNSGKHLLFHSQYHKRTKGRYDDVLVWEEKKAAWARADIKRKWTKN